MPHKKKLTTSSLSVSVQLIERRIYLIRGQKVMIDFDLAELYGVPTKRLNERVARNKKRFPGDFMFRLNKKEAESLRSQNAISNPDLRSQFGDLKFSTRRPAISSVCVHRTGCGHAVERAEQRTSDRSQHRHRASFCRQPATARNSVPFRNHFLSLSTDTCRLMVAKSWPGTSSLRQRIMSVTAKPSVL